MEQKNVKKGLFKTVLLSAIILSILSLGSSLSLVKIEALKETARGSVLTATERGYMVGLVGFSSPPSCTEGICSYSSLTQDASSLQDQIDGYEPLDGTCISCGLAKARDLLSNASGEKHIVLMSDGIPQYCVGGTFCYEDTAKDDALSQVTSARASGMQVDVIGVGSMVDQPFLESLSSTGGGSYYNITCACSFECVYNRVIDASKDNVVLVSDLSGSMADILTLNCTTTTTTSSPTTTLSKMEYTKGALDSAVDNSIGRSDPVGLVAFSSPPSCSQGICSSTEVTYNSTRLYSQISEYQPLDGTCISCGIHKGIELLSGMTGPRYMILLSDGVPQYCTGGTFCYEDQAKADALAQAAAASAEGIKMYTVGIGTVVDEPFMENLSATAGGEYYEPTCGCSLDCVYQEIVDKEDGKLILVNDVSGSMEDSSWINCSATTTTTTSTTSTSTSTSTSSTSSTTSTQASCDMPGDVPPCDVISLGEVVSAITRWASGEMGLAQIIDLINAWAAG